MVRLSRILFVSRLVVLLVATVLVAAAARGESGPVAVIDGFQDTLLDVMKRAEALGVEGRYQVLEPRIEETFDLQRMIRVAAGSQWTKATPEERARLLEAFTRLTISTYASRFSGYSGESFETLGERPGPRGTVLVDTRIIRTDGPPVSLNYVLQQKENRWRVVDILLDGSVSELAMRRSEYRNLGGGNAAGLAGKLNAKADELMAGQ